MAQIRLDRVSKRFSGGIAVLEQVSFTVEDGEFFILVGPSGCGKSTLLNLIVGLEEVGEGEILVDGERANEFDPKDRNMAMVFQSYAIYPHMSVRENLAFPLRMAKLGRDEIARRVHRAAAILELESLLDRKPATLSGGQRQRVAMGRAMVREPKAFLLDEPLSNLDAKLRVQMRAEILRLQKRLGATMIYVTHDQTEAMTLGDRVAVLNRGRVQQIDTPQVLYERPANLFVASFLGSPPMNFLPAHRIGSRLELPMVDFEMPEHLRGRAHKDLPICIAGVRPEHLQEVGSAPIDSDSGAVFTASVEAVEWLGADAFVHVQVPCDISQLPEDFRGRVGARGEFLLTARLDPSLRIREGDTISLVLDTRKVHLFDPGTGQNVDF
ncbi:MAG: ABC transporter ATP-binding protein [Gammaproteobacteria bacterium]